MSLFMCTNKKIEIFKNKVPVAQCIESRECEGPCASCWFQNFTVFEQLGLNSAQKSIIYLEIFECFT